MAGDQGYQTPDEDLLYMHPDVLMGRALGSETGLMANSPTPSVAAAKPAPQAGGDAVNTGVAPTALRTPAPAPLPAAPVRDAAADAALQAKRAQYATPTDPKSVRPSFWKQLIGYAGAAAGGAEATMGRHPHETDIGSRIGYNLWQKPMEDAEYRRKQNLAGIDEQIGASDKKYHDAMEAFQGTVTGYKATTDERKVEAEDQLHADQLNEKKGEIIKQYTAEEPKDVDPKTGKGRIHQYEVDRAGKVYDRGVAPKDPQLEEQHRHNVADEANARDRNAIDRDKATSSKRDLALAAVEKDKETAYQKLEKETQAGLDKAAANPNGYGEPLPVNDPGRKAREAAIYAGKAAQAKMIEDGYNARRAQLGAGEPQAAQNTPSGSKTSQVTGATAQPQASAERISVIRPDGIAGTIPKSQSGMIGKGKYKGWKLGAAQ